MSKQLLYFVALFVSVSAYSQTTINGSFQHNGTTRNYSFYVPAIYNASNPVPLVFNLHGYTSNGQQQAFYGDFRPIADTANFIVVHPEGSIQPASTSTQFWNVGFFPSNVNDVDFLEKLIDTIAASHNIDLSRVYSTGMSNGGYMSFELACHSGRFAAIASVTGSMTSSMEMGCNPLKPTPVMLIHGTADPTVPYDGATGSLAISDVLNYWASFNNCPVPPSVNLVPDLILGDMSSAEHSVYQPGDNGVTMEHFKVINGGHTWPGASINIGTTCMDFSASKEIWRFFSQYTNPLASIDAGELNRGISFGPNPATDYISVFTEAPQELSATICDLDGRLLIQTQGLDKLDVRSLSSGVYFLTIRQNGQMLTERIIKN